MQQPDISIIIPVYNTGIYLIDCMNSVVNQTHSNIEIICVDDASEDNSRDILKKYAINDSRIRIIFEEYNVGTSKARKDGVLKSTGKYILFLDADDYVMKNACERLFEVVKNTDIDMVQFGVSVKTCNEMSFEQSNIMEKNIAPYLGSHHMDEIRTLCFKEKKISHNLCGKLFKANICKNAFSNISDEKLIMAEDLYAFLALTEVSESYLGITDILYIYNYGRGITGKNRSLLEMFEVYCGLSNVIKACFYLLDRSPRKYLGDYIKSNLLDSYIWFITQNRKELGYYSEKILINIFNKYWDKNCVSKMLSKALKENYCNKELIESKKWVFPFSKVKKRSKIVLYGAGDVGHDYYKQIQDTDYCEVVAWVDKSFENYLNDIQAIVSPKVIKEIKFDFIIIAVYNKIIKESIKKDLIKLGVEERKILS